MARSNEELGTTTKRVTARTKADKYWFNFIVFSLLARSISVLLCGCHCPRALTCCLCRQGALSPTGERLSVNLIFVGRVGCGAVPDAHVCAAALEAPWPGLLLDDALLLRVLIVCARHLCQPVLQRLHLLAQLQRQRAVKLRGQLVRCGTLAAHRERTHMQD